MCFRLVVGHGVSLARPYDNVWNNARQGRRVDLMSHSSPVTTGPARTAEPDAAGAAPSPRRERDPWLDNAKFVLVALVVVGHFLTGIIRHVPAAHVLYLWIFSFHIPSFVFLAGYLSRSRSLEARALQNVVTRLLAPYLMFTAVYAVATVAWFGQNRAELIDPYWLLWFLPALAAWRIGTPLLLNLRWTLAIALALGLGAGVFSQIGSDFTLQRIFALAPFYVLGAVVSPALMDRLRSRAAAMTGAGVLLLALPLTVLVRSRYENPQQWLYWNWGYDRLKVDTATGMGLRLSLYLVTAIMIFAALAVMPRAKSFITSLGAASIYTYLLHGLLVKTLQVTGVDDRVTGIFALVLAVALCVAAAALLASGPVRKVFRPVVEPRLRWLLRPVPTRSSGT